MPPARHDLEIRCTACGRMALARMEPLYTGFRKTGECYVCTACGHRYGSREQTPFVAQSERPAVFTDADRPQALQVFREDERRRCCTWCAHFVVNPFGQRCGLTNRETEATDCCERFEARPTPEASTHPPAPPKDPLSKLFGE